MQRNLNFASIDHFNKMPLGQWLEQQTAVSGYDFKKNPNRKKLNVLISSTNHRRYRLTQL